MSATVEAQGPGSLQKQNATTTGATGLGRELPGAPGFRVRSYCPADHERVVALFVEGMLEQGRSVDDGGRTLQVHQDYNRLALEAEMGSPERLMAVFGLPGATQGDFFVVTPDAQPDKIAAFVGMERLSDESVELRRMSVDSGFRRRGLASALVRHLEAEACARGFAKVELSTGAHMASARALYTTLGYGLLREEDYTVGVNAGVVHVAYYEKALAAKAK